MPETEAPAREFSHREIMIVLGGVATGMALAGLDQTIVATALPTIVGELGGLDHLSWVVTAYLLTSTVSTPLWGKLSDLYGRRLMFQSGIVIFVVGSALCGVAQNMFQLVLFRGVQGIGGGGLLAMAFAIIGDVIPPRERGRYTGYLGSVFAITSVVGPLLGGLFVDHLTWRWIFYVNLPLGIVALFVTSSVLHLPFTARRHRIDYEGSVLLVVGVSCLLLALVWGGQEYAWGSTTIVGLGLGGVALLAVFVWWEARAVEPILPLGLFRNPVFTNASGLAFLLGISMFGAVVFLPLFLQIVSGASATNSGLLLLPLMLGLLASAIVSGRFIARTGRYKQWPILGFGLATVAMFLLSTLEESTSTALTTAYMVLLGAGLGMTSPVLVLVVQNAVPPSDLGVATGANTFFRNLGGSFGVALYGAILNARLTSELPKLVPEDAVRQLGGDLRSLLNSPEQIRALPGVIESGLVEAVDRAVGTVFLWSTPLLLLAFAIAVFLPEVPLRERNSLAADAAEAAGAPTELVP